MENDFLVTVARGPGDFQAQYRFSQIQGLHWDCVTGGVNIPLPWTVVMGYVWCNGMESGELSHSCAHGPPPHRIKVCLFKTHNKKNWNAILESVGPR